MPTCMVTLSEAVPDPDDDQLAEIRRIVAQHLDSRARRLDLNHIVVRVIRSQRGHMLGEVELEVFAQAFIPRIRSRDDRARRIASDVRILLNFDCACWINLGLIGYSRVTKDGQVFFSD